MGLGYREAEALFREEGRAYVRRRLLMFLEDGSLSPTEDAVLDDLVRSVGLGPQWGEETEHALEAARRTWRLAHGPLPVVATRLGLVGDEAAHVAAACSAYEDREKTVGVSYAGLTLSLPIVSGMRFRVGQFGVNRQSLRYSHRLGTGDLTVTSERLIFNSPDRAITAKLTSIIDVTAYKDGVTIQRTQGKPLTFVLETPDEDFALILWRAWQAARGSGPRGAAGHRPCVPAAPATRGCSASGAAGSSGHGAPQPAAPRWRLWCRHPGQGWRHG